MPLRLILFILVCVCALLTGRWITDDFVGQALIAYGETAETRDQAVAYAPRNPEVLAARARYLLYRADPIQPERAMADLEQAVRISPRDYRFRLELGKAYELSGEGARAEASLQRAVELAPRYFETHWALANLRLRSGQTDAALAEFRAALGMSGGFATPPHREAALTVYATITQALGEKFETLKQITPADNVSQSYLAEYLAANHGGKGLDAALEIWRRVPPEDKVTQRRMAFQLLWRTEAAHRFTDEREIWQSLIRLGEIEANDAEQNLITNGGFERPPVSERFQSLDGAQAGFDWVFAPPHPQVRMRRDSSVAHSGARALALAFNTLMRSEFQGASQLIQVEPARAYQLSYFVKTTRLPDAGPFVELRDAVQPESFTVRATVPGGTSDWREVRLVFTTPPQTRALRLLIRCPVLFEFSSSNQGELWFDDFRLETVK
jgi:tetratricopeptide (TPR) repeat protein